MNGRRLFSVGIAARLLRWLSFPNIYSHFEMVPNGISQFSLKSTIFTSHKNQTLSRACVRPMQLCLPGAACLLLVRYVRNYYSLFKNWYNISVKCLKMMSLDGLFLRYICHYPVEHLKVIAKQTTINYKPPKRAMVLAIQPPDRRGCVTTHNGIHFTGSSSR